MKTLDKLIDKFKEFREELNKNVNMSYASQPNLQMTEKAEAGPKAKALVSDKPIKLDEVSDAGPASFKIEPKRGQKVKQIDIPRGRPEKMSVKKNGQWSLD